jgi:hypothetical protein
MPLNRRITEFPELPIGRANIIQLDMMHGEAGVYEPKEILAILTSESAKGLGQIPMLYEEDSFVCFAQLELTR